MAIAGTSFRWDNKQDARDIFGKDLHANKFGIQKSFNKLTRVRKGTKAECWLK